jgi:outer membrane protein assembly factor BamB
MLHLVCLDTKGKILWDKMQKPSLPETRYRGFSALHGYASSTPAFDDEAVYTFFGRTGVIAWTHDGEQLWTQSVGDGTHGWGSGTSVVLWGDLVIVNASVESGSLVALNKKNGREVWRQGGMERSWNTPLIVKAGDHDELVVSVKDYLKAYDPATGEPLWTCEGVHDYVCPSVTAHDGVVYALGGRQNTAIAVRPGGKGDVTESHVLWRKNIGSNVSSPVYYDGHLYWASESKSLAYCVNAKTGELVYEEKLSDDRMRIYASPLIADGHIYYVSRLKGAFVVPAKPAFEVLAHNVISSDQSVFNASPVPLGSGQFLLRSDRFLYCIGKK